MPTSPIVLMGRLRPHGGTASSWGDCVLMGGLRPHGGTASSWGDCVLMGRLRPHGGTASSWGDCIFMGGLCSNGETASSWGDCVLMGGLHVRIPKRKTHQRGPCFTVRLALAYLCVSCISKEGPPAWTMPYSRDNFAYL